MPVTSPDLASLYKDPVPKCAPAGEQHCSAGTWGESDAVQTISLSFHLLTLHYSRNFFPVFDFKSVVQCNLLHEVSFLLVTQASQLKMHLFFQISMLFHFHFPPDTYVRLPIIRCVHFPAPLTEQGMTS